MDEEPNDTHPKAEKVLIDLLRKKTVAQKFAMMRSLSETAIYLSKRAIARANPGLDDDHVNLIFIELQCGRELAERWKKYIEQKSDKT